MKESSKIYLSKRIVQAKLFIDANFSKRICLQNIAGEACFSRFHFIRLFKSIYGKTPHQYLIKVRLENAKELLQKGMPVTKVCFTVGFESAGSFSALFLHYTKLSPSAYQQQHKARQAMIRTAPFQFIPNCFAMQKGWL